jgi:hypothetical protein
MLNKKARYIRDKALWFFLIIIAIYMLNFMGLKHLIDETFSVGSTVANQTEEEMSQHQIQDNSSHGQDYQPPEPSTQTFNTAQNENTNIEPSFMGGNWNLLFIMINVSFLTIIAIYWGYLYYKKKSKHEK